MRILQTIKEEEGQEELLWKNKPMRWIYYLWLDKKKPIVRKGWSENKVYNSWQTIPRVRYVFTPVVCSFKYKSVNDFVNL